MTTEQKLIFKEEMKQAYSGLCEKFPVLFDYLLRDFLKKAEQLEKQAAIDALAKAERIEEKQEFKSANWLLEVAFDGQTQLGARCGTFATYLTNFIDQMTPDQREIIAIQFDQNLFGTDKAMAERFRNLNNTSHENN